MAEGPETRSLGRRLADHWIVVGLGIAASLTAIYVVFVPPSPPSIVVNPPEVEINAPPTNGLEVMDAELRPETNQRHILWLIPFGRDYLHTYEVTLRNNERVARTGCSIIVKFTNAAGGEGWEQLFPGFWLDWYRGEGASPFFDLPADPAFDQPLFAMPDGREVRFNNARMRVTCRGPDKQISPWHEVDLSGAAWEGTR